jgi:GT2 family glycosyltransferase
VTIVVVPRERFGRVIATIRTIYERTSEPFRLVCVDGNPPRGVRRKLRALARERRFELIETSTYVVPNHGRNLALPGVDTEYVVFVDNDVVVAPGWLEALVRCAEETGAWVVGPLYFIHATKYRIVHMAGGLGHVAVTDGGVANMVHELRFQNVPYAKLPEPVLRLAVELIEFHCFLVRAAALPRVGRFEDALSLKEEVDFCMTVRALGGEVYLEPAAEVTYLDPPPIGLRDIPYFRLRWSDAWNERSLEILYRTWGLSPESPFVARHLRWLHGHRSRLYRPLYWLPVHPLVKRGGWHALGARLPCGAVLRGLIKRVTALRSGSGPTAGS